ncbi:hypothetical protein [Dyadobacter alkalitolerans]|nr:hypothetical protein [Dyadobacter alkalitolerans]
MSTEKDIFARLQAGELLRKDDPEYGKFAEVVARTIRLSQAFPQEL